MLSANWSEASTIFKSYLVEYGNDVWNETVIYDKLDLFLVACSDVGDGPGRLFLNAVFVVDQQFVEGWQGIRLQHSLHNVTKTLIAKDLHCISRVYLMQKPGTIWFEIPHHNQMADIS